MPEMCKFDVNTNSNPEQANVRQILSPETAVPLTPYQTVDIRFSFGSHLGDAMVLPYPPWATSLTLPLSVTRRPKAAWFRYSNGSRHSQHNCCPALLITATSAMCRWHMALYIILPSLLLWDTGYWEYYTGYWGYVVLYEVLPSLLPGHMMCSHFDCMSDFETTTAYCGFEGGRSLPLPPWLV